MPMWQSALKNKNKTYVIMNIEMEKGINRFLFTANAAARKCSLLPTVFEIFQSASAVSNVANLSACLSDTSKIFSIILQAAWLIAASSFNHNYQKSKRKESNIL